MRASKSLAILVLAHKDVDQLNRLIKSLQHDDVDVYIHIDAKKSRSFRNSVGGGCFLMPLEESVDVSWGDIGMPLATVKLMKQASCRCRYKYMLLISGQDYPVRSISALLRFLTGSNDYLNVISSHRFDSRYLLYYPSWLIGKQSWIRPIRGLYKFIGMGALKVFFQRKGGPSTRYWCGSSWWALRGEVIEWMLREIDRDPRWLSFYANALNPDEGLFQTLYMNSPYAGENEDILTYIDWSGHGPSPEVLTNDDFESVRDSGKFFARKMESGVSDSLLEMIDNAISAESEVDSHVVCD